MIEVDVGVRLGAFDLDVAFADGGGVTALFGRSGSGKSVTLSLIAGLQRPDRGYIRLDGERLVDVEQGIFLPPHQRRIGVVFQDSNLFPHLSVKQNLLFGRWFAPDRKSGIDFDAVIEILGIKPLLKRPPARLSGGERQRVAIGRALLSCPRLLLFDEPMAALDQERKLEILPLIERVRDEFRVPMIYVSHAVEEVVRLADLVVLIRAGKVKAIGRPDEVLTTASNDGAEKRFDRVSILTAKVAGFNEPYGLTKLNHAAGTIWFPAQIDPIGGSARVLIKAIDVVLALKRPDNTSIQSVLHGQVGQIDQDQDKGLAMAEVELDGGERLFSMVTRHAVDQLGLSRGVEIFALIKSSALDERMIGAARSTR